MQQSALLNADSYKLGHASLFPAGMTFGYSNFTPRSFDYMNAGIPKQFKIDSTVWLGMRMFLVDLKQVWQESFFDRNKEEVIAEYKEFILPFAGDIDVSHIEKLHDIGYLPIEIKSLPEGSLVPVGVPAMTISNTHPDMAWFPNYLETWLSADLWKTSTAATIALTYRRIANYWYTETGGNKALLPLMCHDFSLRGMSGIQDGARTGVGHLSCFVGTDNLPAVRNVNLVYRGKETFVGCSVLASEHSVTTCGGVEGEFDTIKRFLTDNKSGIISLVADSYDYFKFISEYLVELKPIIMSRVATATMPPKTVIRPDSGEPIHIICGYKSITRAKLLECEWEAYDAGYEVVEFEDGTFFELIPVFDRYDGCFEEFEYGDELSRSEVKGSLNILWEIFGGNVNSNGYKQLDEHIGLIYGDSITMNRAHKIWARMAEIGFAADNVCFGVGSATYQGGVV